MSQTGVLASNFIMQADWRMSGVRLLAKHLFTHPELQDGSLSAGIPLGRVGFRDQGLHCNIWVSYLCRCTTFQGSAVQYQVSS